MKSSRASVAWVAALLWSGTGPTLLACPICFQVDQGPVTAGVQAAVFVLMGVTMAVLTGFGLFVGRLARTPEPPEPRNPGTLGLP